jgi:hypothetical protein
LNELSKIKPVFTEKKYVLVFLTTTITSVVLFMLLTLLFEYSQFLFFNYFLKEGFRTTVSTFAVMAVFSLVLGFATSFVLYNFKHVLEKKTAVFLGITWVLYVISYILMLANTSYSLFSYTEMNGFPYTFLNFLLIALILPLSGLLIVNAYTVIRNAKSGVSGASGLAAGVFSMGCPTCGALLLSLFGVTAGLTIFPLKGLEIKMLSLGLLGFTAYRFNSKTCSSCTTPVNLETKHLFSQRFENTVLMVLALTGGLLFFNQMQLSSISSSLDEALMTSAGQTALLSASKIDLSGVDVSQVNSTAMAIATVFPELKNAQSEEEVLNVMLASGTPEYSEALGGITFDDVGTSKTYLAKWYFSLKEEIQQKDPEIWQRYLNLAAAPRGISCEWCCGVGPQGITSEGKLRCGCAHNVGIQALVLGLMKYTDYSDAEILREVMKWKASFFPRNMVALAAQVAGSDPSQLKNLPGMVGGC